MCHVDVIVIYRKINEQILLFIVTIKYRCKIYFCVKFSVGGNFGREELIEEMVK